MIPILKTLRTLLAYLVLGLPTLLFIWPTAFWIKKNRAIRSAWISFDKRICSFAHGTYDRTISGYTGQFMHKHKRFEYQAKFIDFFAELFGDDPDHCYRAYLYELGRGLVKP
ncbi:hypothetical protein J7384_17070 [Endozoicomonas sp. G2_1]|uniref:hypothetical protein n=1 Tax=Endozoicomonas sp. G2_1 TaxID=2821091 RepID=UPI001ADCB23B|nr:hypothetical protein [Endozoicomonas sp. G2_1]MBO9492076.1 hypothetical protein [Endozoicomonas sp. G2_1]